MRRAVGDIPKALSLDRPRFLNLNAKRIRRLFGLFICRGAFHRSLRRRVLS